MTKAVTVVVHFVVGLMNHCIITCGFRVLSVLVLGLEPLSIRRVST